MDLTVVRSWLGSGSWQTWLAALLLGAAGAATAQTDVTQPDLSVPVPAYQPAATPATVRAAAARRAPKASRSNEAPAPVTATPAMPAVPLAPAAAAPGSAPGWEVRVVDRTLSTTFTRWANTAGWQLLWEMPLDYVIDASTRIEGSFEQAVEAVAESLATADNPMQVIFYKGNKVIRIVSKGSQ